MKLVAKTLIAALMLAGTISAVSTKAPKTSLPGFSDGGPAPLCLPSEPNCKPPIPPAAR